MSASNEDDLVNRALSAGRRGSADAKSPMGKRRDSELSGSIAELTKTSLATIRNTDAAARAARHKAKVRCTNATTHAHTRNTHTHALTHTRTHQEAHTDAQRT